MPMRHLHVPGVTCAPDDFDSFAVMGTQPIPRLQPLQPVPWNGVERRADRRVNEGAALAPTPEVPLECGPAVEACSLTHQPDEATASQA